MKLDRLKLACEIETLLDDLRTIDYQVRSVKNGILRRKQNGSEFVLEPAQYSSLEWTLSQLERIENRLLLIQERLEDSQDYLNNLTYQTSLF